MSDRFEREAPTLSESQRAQRQKQLLDQDRDFQRKRREFQEDLNARKNEELQQVLERANRVVKQVAEAEKYDVDPAGSRLHQPQARHHRQGDQGAQRRQIRRPVADRADSRPAGVPLRLGAIVEALGGELHGDPALAIERPGPAGSSHAVRS